MAFPAVQGTPVEDLSSTTTNSPTHALSGSIVAGELLMLVIASGGDGACTLDAVTGWSELIDENAARGLHVLYRWADGLGGTPETSPLNTPTTGTATRFASICYRISGAENPSTQVPEISAVATGTSDAPNPNTCTPTGGAKDYLWFTCATRAGEEADDDTWTNNAATGYGSLLQKSSGTGGTNVGAQICISNRTNNAASEDAAWPAGSWDASAAWRAFTIAIHPPGGGAAPGAPNFLPLLGVGQ